MTTHKMLIVLGMHRSGTSAVAGMLKHLGVRFGRHLIPAISGVNDKGFYEDLDVVERNQAILAQLGKQWLDFSPMPDGWWQTPGMSQHQQAIQQLVEWYAGHGLAGFKDPRLCRLLPLWLDAFVAQGITPHFIIALRDPDAVAASLHRRDAMDSGAAYGLWLAHMLEAERHTQPYSRVFVAYPQLLADWRGVAGDIGDAFGITWPTRPDSIGHTLDSFIDSRLNHHVPDQPARADAAMAGDLRDQAKQLFAALQAADWQACSTIQASFTQTIQGMSPILPVYIHTQLLRSEKQTLGRGLQAEKDNAKEQIEYRDALLQQTQAALQAEKHNAAAQIEYRDALLQQTQAALQAQIEYQDTMIKHLRERTVMQVAKEKIMLGLSRYPRINQGVTWLRQFPSRFSPGRRR